MDKRPVGHVVNPEAAAAARARGWPMTALADAATLAGIPLWVPRPETRPEGHITNPAVIAEARRLGAPMTAAGVAEIANLTGLRLYVEGTDEGVDAGLREMAQARRQAELEKQSQQHLRKSGLIEPDVGA